MSASISSLQSQLASISSVMATETRSATLSLDMVTYSLINASINLVSAKEVLSTATDSAAASAAVSSASSVLYSLVSVNNPYGTVPSEAGNIAFAVIMAVILVAHSLLGFFFQTWWFGITTFIGVGLELIGYIARTLSVNNLFSKGLYAMQMATLTFAPAFMMAGIYYLLAQLVTIYGTEQALVKPKAYKRIFIGSDVVSFIVQAAGGAIASSSTTKAALGTDIIIAGIAIQLIGMTGFLILFSHYFYKIGYITGHVRDMESRGEYPPQYAYIRSRPMFVYFPIGIFVAVIFVYIRSLYRIVELADGWKGFLITHEVYFFILDSAMISIACMVTAVFHPGPMMGKGDPLKRTSLEDVEKSYENKTHASSATADGDQSDFGAPYSYKNMQ